ncbi:serpin B11 isoform X1 [Ochotona curzoniae]|uniref:serpin B11 isoform X1 n=1 Tax=Ochotona curzoniae TaxID=130825 RepID=UPI001B351109|nr:serpin B11 isoform X1 [Ochotona curzoniae]
MDSLSTAGVEFCLDVLKELNSNSAGDNVFFSPLSLLYALHMILLGAGGNSAEQIKKVLHFNHIAEASKSEFTDSLECSQAGRTHSDFGVLISQINQLDSNYILSIANRLYGTKKMAFHQKYLTCSEKLYQTRLQTVDFEKSTEETRKKINAWVESRTNGKVTNLFGEGAIDPSSVLVLVNAVYFKGQWLSKFQARETVRAPFQLAEGKSVLVEMMYQTGMFKLAVIERPQMQVLELPYVNNRLSMLVLLPTGTTKLEQIAKQLNVRTFEKWTGPSNMVEREVEVHLPRFKLDVQYELNSLLKSLGMTDIFNKDKADLSGMSSAKGLYLSKVIHKSYVDVNEEGTEAAAATGANIAVKRLPIRYQFTANKPFLFLIRDNPSKMIVFCGKFASP